MVLNLDEPKGAKEFPSRKRTKSTTRKIKEKNDELIKEDIKVIKEKIKGKQ